MTDNKDQPMNGEDFSQDVNNEDEPMNGDDQNQQQQNGGGGGGGGAGVRDDDRKLFVGGLSWETQEKELREHFGAFGEIESINVKTDPTTGRSRGFAFIVYKTSESLDKVAAHGEHVINGKKVDPKKAKARHGKIFIGGLTPEISDEEIKTFFGQFGNIVEVEMPFDKQKNQRKAFCFITFDSEQVVNELLKTPKQTISGKEVDVKRATPKPDNMPPMMMMRGGRMPRGGPRGKGGYPNWNNQGYGYSGYGQGYGGYESYGYDNYGPYGGGYYGGYDYSGAGGNFQGGKQRGGRQQRHQPY